MPASARHAAFTLLELLVVVAIVAVLAIVLAPELMKMTLQSRSVQCIGNLRQIGTAVFAHAGDHGGLMPIASGAIPYQTTDASTGLPGWTEQLTPYLGTDRKIYFCPSSGPILPTNKTYSYFLGSHAAYVASGGPAPVRLPLIVAPDKFILGGDIASDNLFTALDADKNDNTQNPAFAPMTRIFHGKKVNLLFADGHAGTFAAFDRTAMTVRYGLRPDGTGYNYTDTD